MAAEKKAAEEKRRLLVSEQLELRKADLSGARVTDDQLHQAKSLEGAIMPDGTVHE